jgi:serine/threonine protein kinase
MTRFSLADGRFQLRRRLGSGASGVVYDAVDVRESRIVAIKILREVERIYRFKQEFRRGWALDHPNVVRLLEQFQEGARCFFTMELVEGMPIVDYVRGAHPRGLRPLTVEEYARARAVLTQVIAGVGALHGAGLRHGDLKPANVLVSDNDVSIVDLDFAHDIQTSSSLQPKLSGGTPLYMAPELLSDATLTEAADWYSVGVMMYELLTGRTPFEGLWLQVLSQKRDADVFLPGDVDGGDPLAQLCAELLKRNPDARPAGAEIRERYGTRNG